MDKKTISFGIIIFLLTISLGGCNEQKNLDKENGSKVDNPEVTYDNQLFIEWCGDTIGKIQGYYETMLDAFNKKDYLTTNSLTKDYVDNIWTNMSEIYTFNVIFNYDFQRMIWDYMNATLYGIYYINEMADHLYNKRNYEYLEYKYLYDEQVKQISFRLNAICYSLDKEGYPQEWCKIYIQY